MERHGIECIAANDMFGHKHVSPQELGDMELDSSIGAVVVGLDWEVTYTKVAYATRLLRENPGCIYLSTNQDSTFPAKKGVQLPGGGTCVSMLTFASGVTPINCGKPEPWILNMALRNFNLDPARTMMVGDRLNTDVEFGQVGGLHTMLVFSGVTTPAALKESETIPTYKGTDVTALVGGLVEEEKKECVQ